jgi:hypothetical protein
MNTSQDKVNVKSAMDPIDRLIFEEGLKIKSVWIDKDLDLIVLLLNNRKIIQRALSEFPTLSKAALPDVLKFENNGFGIHWPALDEDLSLRGFLKTELLGMSPRANS